MQSRRASWGIPVHTGLPFNIPCGPDSFLFHSNYIPYTIRWESSITKNPTLKICLYIQNATPKIARVARPIFSSRRGQTTEHHSAVLAIRCCTSRRKWRIYNPGRFVFFYSIHLIFLKVLHCLKIYLCKQYFRINMIILNLMLVESQS